MSISEKLYQNHDHVLMSKNLLADVILELAGNFWEMGKKFAIVDYIYILQIHINIVCTI